MYLCLRDVNIQINKCIYLTLITHLMYRKSIILVFSVSGNERKIAYVYIVIITKTVRLSSISSIRYDSSNVVNEQKHRSAWIVRQKPLHIRSHCATAALIVFYFNASSGTYLGRGCKDESRAYFNYKVGGTSGPSPW